MAKRARLDALSVVVVLDGAGLQAWAQGVPPRQLLIVMEGLRRAGAGWVLVPSIVVVEALTASERDAPINQAIKPGRTRRTSPARRSVA